MVKEKKKELGPVQPPKFVTAAEQPKIPLRKLAPSH